MAVPLRLMSATCLAVLLAEADSRPEILDDGQRCRRREWQCTTPGSIGPFCQRRGGARRDTASRLGGHHHAEPGLGPSNLRGLLSCSVPSNLAALQADVSSWPVPSLALTRGTVIGARGYDYFYGELPPGAYWRSQRMEDQFDAVLHLGPASSITMSGLSFPRCAAPEYIEMRVRRMTMLGAPASVADRLKQDCAASASNRQPRR